MNERVVRIAAVLSVAHGASDWLINVGAEPYIEGVFENEVAELDAAATLAAVEANEHVLITAETRRLQLAAHWADIHPGDAVAKSRLPGTERPVRLGGDRTPTVGDFAATELGCALRISDGAAARLIADALDLRHRLRLIWSAAQAGQAPAHQVRHIATATRHLSAEEARCVDERIAPALGTVPWSRLNNLLEAAILEADPVGAEQRAAEAAQERFVRLGRSSEHGLKMIFARVAAGDALWIKAVVDRIADILGRRGDTDSMDARRSKALGILARPAEAQQLLSEHLGDDWDGPAEPTDVDGEQSLRIVPPPFDPKRARPRAVVYVHLSAEALTAGVGVTRVEEVGPVLLGRLGTLLGERCSISLKPVIDLPAGHIPIDSYEIPATLREQILLRYPADVFPYAAAVSRRIDLDHTVPYLYPDEGGPPGQTRIGNLGPHVRFHHRLKTHAGWQVRQPEPGIWLWRSPHKRVYLVNNAGSHVLGNTEFAQAIWRAAEMPAPALLS